MNRRMKLIEKLSAPPYRPVQYSLCIHHRHPDTLSEVFQSHGTGTSFRGMYRVFVVLHDLQLSVRLEQGVYQKRHSCRVYSGHQIQCLYGTVRHGIPFHAAERRGRLPSG